MPKSILADQHNQEIQENALSWKRKKVLRLAYAVFYKEIRRHLSTMEGLTVELGSGIGQIKEFIPEAVTTDLFANPWLDRVENSYCLTFPNESISNLVLFDVWHHLEFPGTALREAYRVLKPGGRLHLFEPAMGLVGRFVYQRFHHEPLGFEFPIQWEAPVDFRPTESRYYAAQGNAWRLFYLGEFSPHGHGWKTVAQRYWPALFYLASGGFRGPQLYPDILFPLLCGLDRCLAGLPKIFASRMLVVLEKEN